MTSKDARHVWASLFRCQDANTLPADSTALKRCLSAVDLVLLGVGNTVGSGIFILIGVAVHQAGPAVTLCLVFAGLATLCSALCYAEFAARFPVVGSAYAFTYLEAGELLAWNVGWVLVFEWVVAFAAVGLGWSEYMRAFLRGLGVSMPWYLSGFSIGSIITIDIPALAFIVFLSASLCAGISEAKWLNHFATVSKLCALLMVIALGFYRADTSNWHDFMPHGTSGLFAGAGSVMVAYLGFDTVCNAAEEAKDPSVSLPIGIVGTVVVSGFVYVLVGAALTLMVYYAEVDLKAPLADAFVDWLPWMVPVISFAAVIGLFAIGLGCILAGSRLVMTLARDGLLPSVLGEIQEWRRTIFVAQDVLAGTWHFGNRKFRIVEDGSGDLIFILDSTRGILCAVDDWYVAKLHAPNSGYVRARRVESTLNLQFKSTEHGSFGDTEIAHQFAISKAPVVSTVTAGGAAFVLCLCFSFQSLIMMISVGTISSLSMVCVDLILARKRCAESNLSLVASLTAYVACCFATMFGWRNGFFALSVFSAALTAMLAVSLCLRPDTNTPKATFVAPAGTVVALLGIAMNTVMISSLKVNLQFVIGWFVVGLVVYLCYGRSNSKLAQATDEISHLVSG
eukprot:TRINITY_DN71173_c0_g1_i1.p1 TRINITY_DN71173_c0_g1~~TRINITY_DN71173_c0_g1_i1.p1  ORF type:complete len:623 (+),score=58.70 TRINITY_DN71173_c0_g1_i1:70-1938(+)